MSEDIQCLLVSNTLDYSTDLVCLELERLKAKYLRLNRDQFSQFEITIDIDSTTMTMSIGERSFHFKNAPENAVYYRAPTFLRGLGKSYSIEEQLYHSQWSAFVRNLAIFDKVRWINNPVDTYRAENKLLQLSLANKCGLETPKTIVTNSADSIDPNKAYAVKSIDTAVFSAGEVEMFSYTSKVCGKAIQSSNMASAPVFVQEYLGQKIDIRATYISGKLFPVSITKQGLGISGDWRKTKKEELEYLPIKIPLSIEEGLCRLMKSLRLSYGGIDLAKAGDTYFFIEVNPTGEWHWLQSNTDINFSEMIAETLFGLNAIP